MKWPCEEQGHTDQCHRSDHCRCHIHDSHLGTVGGHIRRIRRPRRGRRQQYPGFLALAIVAPLAATIIQLAISRSREFAADGKEQGSVRNHGLLQTPGETGIWFCSLPPRRGDVQASDSTAHMFIVNPLKGGGFSNLFRTHIPPQKRG